MEKQIRSKDLSRKRTLIVGSSGGDVKRSYKAMYGRTRKWSLVFVGISMACLCVAIIISGFLSVEKRSNEPNGLRSTKEINIDSLRQERANVLTP